MPSAEPAQIDLEEAIAAHPLTIAEFADRGGYPVWRVRRSVDYGTLQVNREKYPMTVEGGEVLLSVHDWQRTLKASVDRIKPSVLGWSDGGKRLSILGLDGHMRTWRLALTKSSAEMQAREIDALACRRLEG